MPSPFPMIPPKDPTQSLTVSVSPSSGMTQATYWKRLNQRLDVAAELQALTTPGPMGRREAIASVGFKMQTIFSVVRGMIDTGGRVSGTSEYTLAPGLVFSLSGEIDYGKGGGDAGKIGVGFSLVSFEGG
jgi:mitochondrial import receptor subunit TOM40